jgi:hypothetical protein
VAVAVDIFDEIRAKHEGRVMRLRNLPAPEPRVHPKRRWYQWRERRHDRDARRYYECMLAGWWEMEHEILRAVGLFEQPIAS